MAENPIGKDDIIKGEEIRAEIETIISTLEKLSQVMSKDLKAAADLVQKSLHGVNVTTKEGQEIVKQAATKADELNRENKIRIDTDKKLEAAKQKLISIEREEYKEIERLKQQAATRRKQIADEIRLTGSQEGSINKLRQRLKDLTADYNKMGPDAAKKAAAEINKLSDQLKKQESAIGDNRRNVGNYVSALKGMGTQLLSVAGITGGLTMAFNAVKKIINSTQATGDALVRTTTSLKFGFDEVARSIAKMDFAGLNKRIKEAVDRGKEYAQELDDIGDLTRSVNIADAERELQMAKLQKIYRDVAKSDKERLAAAEKYLDIIDEKAQANLEVAEKAFKAELRTAMHQSQLSEERIMELLREQKWMIANTQAVTDYNNAKRILATTEEVLADKTVSSMVMVGDQMVMQTHTVKRNVEELQKYKDIIAATPDDIVKLAEDAGGFNDLMDEQRIKLTTTYTKMLQIQTEAEQRGVRAQSAAGALIKAEATSTTNAVAKEASELDKLLTSLSEMSYDEALKRGDAFFGDLEKRIDEDFDIIVSAYDERGKASREWLERWAADEAWLQEDSIKRTEAAENKKQEIRRAFLDQAAGALNTFSSLFEASKQRELSAAGDNAEKREEIEKKFAKRQQALGIGQALINGAIAITEIQKKWAANPVINAVLTGLTAARTLAEVAVIKSQKFAKGGSGLVDGVLNGNLHSSGGVDLGVIGEAEKGEYFGIVSRSMTRKYQDDLPSIFASLNNGSFHEVWANAGRQIPNSKQDPYTKMMYELMSERPTPYTDSEGNTVLMFGKKDKRVIKKRYN